MKIKENILLFTRDEILSYRDKFFKKENAVIGYNRKRYFTASTHNNDKIGTASNKKR